MTRVGHFRSKIAKEIREEVTLEFNNLREVIDEVRNELFGGNEESKGSKI